MPTPTCRPGSSPTCASALHWDVLFVLEEDDLRRAPDLKHYQLAQQLRRTLVTLDRDYLDDRRFPPAESGGVLVIHAPDERQLVVAARSRRSDAVSREDSDEPVPLPLDGRKLQVNTDWGRELMDAVDDSDAWPRTARRCALPSPSRSTTTASMRGARRRSIRRRSGAAAIARARRKSPAPARATPCRRRRARHRRSRRPCRRLSQRWRSASPGRSSRRRRAGGHRGGRRRSMGRRRRAACSDVVLLRGRRPRDRRHRPRRRAVTGARGRAGVGRLAGAQPGRARGLPEGRLPRSRGRRGRHRAAADLAHQGRRSLARAGRGQRRSSRDHRRPHARRRRAHGDGVSISVVRDTAKYLGMAAANLVVVADPEMLVLGGIMASAADLLLEPIRVELARRLPRRDDGRRSRSHRRRSATTPPRSAPRAGRAPRCDDRPVRRRAGAARPHPLARHARHRRRPHRRDPAGRAVGQPPRIRTSHSTATTSSPASSTCTCTASTASIRSMRRMADAVAADRRAAAAVRRHRVLPDDGRVRAGRAAARARPGPPRARDAVAARRARAAGASREQLHQPRIQGRAALGVLAQPSGCAWRRSGSGRRAGGAQVGERQARPSGAISTAPTSSREIERAAPDVGIVTLAPELDGGLDLIRWLAARGHRVSLGHSAATYDEALAAIAAGARHATHLFNRMPPLGHRAPGSPAPSSRPTRSPRRSSATASTCTRRSSARRSPRSARRASWRSPTAPRPPGCRSATRAALGGQPITAGESTALLADGTIAGSVLTMDRAFQTLVGPVGISLVDAATICATTPARELGLVGHGVLAPDAVADLVVLDANFRWCRPTRRATRLRTKHAWRAVPPSNRSRRSCVWQTVCLDSEPSELWRLPAALGRAARRPRLRRHRRRRPGQAKYVERDEKRFPASGKPDVVARPPSTARSRFAPGTSPKCRSSSRSAAATRRTSTRSTCKPSRTATASRSTVTEPQQRRRLQLPLQQPPFGEADRLAAGHIGRHGEERRRLDRHRADHRPRRSCAPATAASAGVLGGDVNAHTGDGSIKLDGVNGDAERRLPATAASRSAARSRACTRGRATAA